MSDTTVRRSRSSTQLVGLLLLLLLAIALPSIVLKLFVDQALAGKSLKTISNEEMLYSPNVTNKEVWLTIRKELSPPPQQRIEYRVSRTNLQTGQPRETGPVMKIADSFWPLCSTREFYGFSQTSLYQWDGAEYQRLAKQPNSPAFNSVPFDYDGKLTMIIETPDQGFRLVHAADGKWLDGPRIILPPLGWVWRVDPADGLSKLVESESPKFAASDPRWISAMQFGETTHVFITGISGFAAYRSGFQFVEDERQIGDGQAATAVGSAVTGWEQIQPVKAGDSWYGMNCDRDGAFFFSRNTPYRMVRRHADGNWVEITGVEGNKFASLPLSLVDRGEAITYLMNRKTPWETAEISRIEDDHVGPVEWRLAGFVPDYLRRWRILATGMVVAWLLHVGLLALGTMTLRRGPLDSEYEFGGERAVLASIEQRSSAFIIDWLIGIGLMLVVIVLEMHFFGIHRRSLTDQQFAEALLQLARQVEDNAKNGIGQLYARLPEILQMFFGSQFESLPRIQIWSSVLVLNAVAILIVRLVYLMRWSATPGQQLMRIQTLRSTLRPPGIARRLVRDLMYWIDVPFLLTPILGVISVVLSTRRMRWGDRVADTVVVRTGG